jgi:hypothetical protein
MAIDPVCKMTVDEKTAKWNIDLIIRYWINGLRCWMICSTK